MLLNIYITSKGKFLKLVKFSNFSRYIPGCKIFFLNLIEKKEKKIKFPRKYHDETLPTFV